MAYNTVLADRVREILVDTLNVTEKKMFSGIAFMVDEKMCICIVKTGLMCRIDPNRFDELVQKNGVQPMVMKGKEMNGYLLVDEEIVVSNKSLQYWVDICIDFNLKAKSSKKKKKQSIE